MKRTQQFSVNCYIALCKLMNRQCKAEGRECCVMQVQNAVHMGWVDYCAALYTARRMQDDISGRTLIIHNGDVSYAE